MPWIAAFFGTQEPVGTAVDYDAPRKLGVLSDKDISESSGLAVCRSHATAFWTHNDSGDEPRLFLINESGETIAKFRLDLKKVHDWEDICSFQHQETNYLVIGDIGDNDRRRKEYWLHLVREPKVEVDRKKQPKLPVERSIRFTYEDGPRDCEALSVDPTSGIAYLVSKKLFGAGVYELPLFQETPSDEQTARLVATVNIPLASGSDMSPDGTRAIVVTYANALEFVRRPTETWSTAFQRPPRQITMPIRRQGEAICYGANGRTLYLTSEHASQPFWEVPPKKP